jgi:hypothetical protein
MHWLKKFWEVVKCDTYQDNFLEISVFPHWLEKWRVKMSWTLWEQWFTIEYIKNFINFILWDSKQES